MAKGRTGKTKNVFSIERKTIKVTDETKRKIEGWLKNTNMNPRQISELFESVSPHQIDFMAKKLGLDMKNRQTNRTEGGKKIVKAFFELKGIEIRRHEPSDIAKVIELWAFYNEVAPGAKLTSEHYSVSEEKARKMVDFCEKNNLDWKNMYYALYQNIDTIKSRIDKVKSLLKPEAGNIMNGLALFNFDSELNELGKEKYKKLKENYPVGVKTYVRAQMINYLKNPLRTRLGENPYFRGKIAANLFRMIDEISRYARDNLKPEEKVLLVKLAINYECIRALSMGGRYLKQ